MKNESESEAPAEVGDDVNALVAALSDQLPPILWRSLWPTYRLKFGLPYGAATMANKDSAGEGPPAGSLGRKVFYEREAYLSWLAKLPVREK